MHRYSHPNSINGLIEMSECFEEAKFYSILLPYGSQGLDYMSLVPDLVKTTKKIKFMMALRPYAVQPEYAARYFNTMNAFYRNRVTFNLVCGTLTWDGEEEFVLNHYFPDMSLIDTMSKRVELSDAWMKIFYKIINRNSLESYTIANSSRTMELGEKYTNYVIFDHHRLVENFNKVKDTKLVLIIDPLIRETKEELNGKIEYLGDPKRKQSHEIKGTLEEVIQQLKNISKQFGVNDFMVVTDQKDLSAILNLSRILS